MAVAPVLVGAGLTLCDPFAPQSLTEGQSREPAPLQSLTAATRCGSAADCGAALEVFSASQPALPLTA